MTVNALSKAWPSSIIGRKQVFRVPFSQRLTDLDQGSVVAWNTLLSSIWPIWRLCCRETFQKFPTSAEPEQKKRLNFRYLAHSLQEKSYTANQCISPKGCFNPTDINNPQTGKPQTRKTGLRKFVPFILSDVQKIAEFNCEIIFQTRPQMAEISPENWIQWRIHYPGIQKARKCTITPVI